MIFCLLICFSVMVGPIICLPRSAVVHLISEEVTGSITFTEVDDGVHVKGTIRGLEAGNYGFHIHELGDTITCDAAGAHLNPDATNHGGRDHTIRHVGDLGNIQFVGTGIGVAEVDFVDKVIALRGRNNILGRTLVLHGQEDDLGLGGHETSLTTGNAGSRVVCAVIGVNSPVEAWVDE
ncbi:superoxide dismutase [Cu-Zn]-like [Galleria mellonella]|uniref:Superoxide dismutase [Cu-Zn] n=1 Tax=Galleria mellonella TaxID=7137 RepID=A0A6J1X6D0_GALME|nr:superoxide dismutase [Cu-Zn]-like [Galleria mellonella]